MAKALGVVEHLDGEHARDIVAEDEAVPRRDAVAFNEVTPAVVEVHPATAVVPDLDGPHFAATVHLHDDIVRLDAVDHLGELGRETKPLRTHAVLDGDGELELLVR